jgi:hypothetical protein
MRALIAIFDDAVKPNFRTLSFAKVFLSPIDLPLG